VRPLGLDRREERSGLEHSGKSSEAFVTCAPKVLYTRRANKKPPAGSRTHAQIYRFMGPVKSRFLRVLASLYARKQSKAPECMATTTSFGSSRKC